MYANLISVVNIRFNISFVLTRKSNEKLCLHRMASSFSNTSLLELLNLNITNNEHIIITCLKEEWSDQ